MKLLTVFFILIFNVGSSFGQLNFTIKDGVNLLSSNPYFIESLLNYEDYSFKNIESKVHIYNKKASTKLKFIYTSSADRINLISWDEEFDRHKYNLIIQEISSLGFNAIDERLSNYTDFNTSFQGFVSESMNCLVSIIENRNENIFSISLSRKDNNKPLIIPNNLFLFNGSKTFSDGLNGWNINVKIINNQIEIATIPHADNEYWKGKKYSPNVVRGYIKNGIIYSTINEEGATDILPSVYKYFRGKLYELNQEQSYNEYFESPLEDSISLSESIPSILEVEVPAVPIGGVYRFLSDLKTSVKLPKEVEESTRKKTIEISAIIEKDGSLSNITVTKDPFGNVGQLYIYELKLNKWKPSVQNGRIIRSRVTIPISVGGNTNK